MPIVDVQITVAEGDWVPVAAAQVLANALAPIWALPPGRVWVRVASLPACDYAENDEFSPLLPVFLRVLLADLPALDVLAAQSRVIAQAVAACLNRATEQIHIEYAPPGRGRVAFGGELLR